jgi:pimeloyl-ACP methyl ester carboxylesterase
MTLLNSRKFRTLLALVLVICLLGGYAFYMHPLWVNAEKDALKMRLLGARSYEREIAGHHIHFYEAGAGKPLVLVHGLSGHAEEWANLLPYFTHAGFHVYMLDLPGFGHSDRPANYSYSIADQSAVVEAFLLDRGLTHTSLGGWSMGGWIAATVALDHPQQVDRLILLDSAGLKFTLPFNPRLFVPKSAAEMDALDKVLMPNPPQIPTFLMRDIERYEDRNGWITNRAMDSMLTGKDVLDDRYNQLHMPVLLVWGSLDRTTPLSLGITMHSRIQNSQLVVIDGCGHLAPIQCASKIGPQAAHFLTDVHPPSGVTNIR